MLHNQVIDHVLKSTDYQKGNIQNPQQLFYAVRKSYEKVTGNSISTKDNSYDSLTLEYISLILKNQDLMKC